MTNIPPPPQIEFTNVTKTYGTVTAVKDISFSVGRGEFVTILGPSGSGKTTTLMLLSGFETATSGDIRLAGQSITSVPSWRRDQGIVFQNYALFPHLTVRRNLEFPLEMRGIAAAERRRRVDRILERVHLSGYEDRVPRQLSGGQQQRVALARALVADPPVLLLDEPLGALDRNLREQMQGEIKTLHREFGMTTICVTHDQEEALTLSDRIVVMRGGRIEQIDTPEQLYDRPASRFVANFLGEANILSGLDVPALPEGPVPVGSVAMIRPERVRILPCDAAPAPDAGRRQRVAGTVAGVVFAGPIRKYEVRSDSATLSVREHVSSEQPVFAAGDTVALEWLRSDLRVVAE